MLVSFEVRIKLEDRQGRLAMLVRGGIWRDEKRRVLIPFGGGIKIQRDDMSRYKDLLGGLRPDLDDIRFEVPDHQQVRVDSLYDYLAPARFQRDALREFSEEAVDERKLLTNIDEGSWTYLDKVKFIGPSVRRATWGEQTYYGVGIIEILPSPTMLNALLWHTNGEASQIEFVPPELLRVKEGVYTDKGSFIPPVYAYLASY